MRIALGLLLISIVAAATSDRSFDPADPKTIVQRARSFLPEESFSFEKEFKRSKAITARSTWALWAVLMLPAVLNAQMSNFVFDTSPANPAGDTSAAAPAATPPMPLPVAALEYTGAAQAKEQPQDLVL